MKYLLYYLILINVAAFLFMLVDKRKAIRKRWRIPERVLLGLSFIGGSLGGLLAMQLFRHKTKHIKFIVGMPLILVAQIVIAILILT